MEHPGLLYLIGALIALGLFLWERRKDRGP
jgi:hypothetical protein